MLFGGDLSLEIPFHDQLKLCYIRHIAAYHILYQNIHDLHLTTKSTWRPHAKCEEYLYSTTFPSMQELLDEASSDLQHCKGNGGPLVVCDLSFWLGRLFSSFGASDPHEKRCSMVLL